jgi:hypothetical protein
MSKLDVPDQVKLYNNTIANLSGIIIYVKIAIPDNDCRQIIKPLKKPDRC